MERTDISSFVSIDRGGRVKLADGSYWRVAPDYVRRVVLWRRDDVAGVVKNEFGNTLIYPWRLVNATLEETAPCMKTFEPEHWKDPVMSFVRALGS